MHLRHKTTNNRNHDGSPTRKQSSIPKLKIASLPTTYRRRKKSSFVARSRIDLVLGGYLEYKITKLLQDMEAKIYSVGINSEYATVTLSISQDHCEEKVWIESLIKDFDLFPLVIYWKD